MSIFAPRQRERNKSAGHHLGFLNYMLELPSASGRTLPMVMTLRTLFLFEVTTVLKLLSRFFRRDVGTITYVLDERL